MSIAILTAEPDAVADRYRAILAAALPDLDIHLWPDLPAPEAVTYALVWQPPEGALGRFPNLKAIFNLGAGVDAILRDPSVPADVPLVRLADAGMASQMVEYALYGVLHVHRDMDVYRRHQAEGRWEPQPYKAPADTRVGILGLGALGAQVAEALAVFGFSVAGWSRTPKLVRSVTGFHGLDRLDAFLARTDVLVNLLPLTAETRGLLNAERLARLPAGASLINCARGAHVVEADLVAALDSGHVRHALLDVFDPEPLPADSPLWRHPSVQMTPHVAAQTIPMEACKQIVNNIKRLEQGRPPHNTVDRQTGY